MKDVSRREFLGLSVAGALGAQTRRRPNILLIFADDLGWRDVGFNGTDFYETPNIDRLAREGMVFGNAYAAAGNCAPSRACMVSGQYGPRHGVYAVESTKRGPVEKMRLEPVPNKQFLDPENVTFAEALRAAGYATGHFGKWHLGGKPGQRPVDQGFDVSLDPRPNPNAKRDEPRDPKGLFTITRQVVDFMTQNRERPWFAYVAHHAIHTSLEAQPETLARFEAKRKGAQHGNPLYAACLADFDTGVGQLLAKLGELGLTENTLVLFTSDNGGTQQSSQEPLRGNKGCYYEGGIREPMIVRWPGVTKVGSRCDVPVINLDFYPTFLDAAGARAPEGKTLDGETLVPLLRGGARLEREAIFWHFPGYLDDPVIRGRDRDFRSRPTSVIRKGRWKLHLYHEEWLLDKGVNALELYDLVADPGEHRNLAAVQTKMRDELLRDLRTWMERVKAPMPKLLEQHAPSGAR